MTVEAARVLLDLQHGRLTGLARAVSLVENGGPEAEQLLAGIHGTLGRARRIGITGPPGAGKSTLTDLLARRYRSDGHRVGILAIDPTSPYTGGALLGDRIRMAGSAVDPDVYIRSMATRGSLGGLATTTGEAADVLDAAGFERIIVETVGVGQSELDVAGNADTVVLVVVPESGDGIQTLKAGVMEAADVFIVNKADRPGAEALAKEIDLTLHLRQGKAYRGVRGHAVSKETDVSGWTPPVVMTVATDGTGMEGLVDAVDRHWDWLEGTGALEVRRARRVEERTRAVVTRALARWGWEASNAGRTIEESLARIADGALSPYDVAAKVVKDLKARG